MSYWFRNQVLKVSNRDSDVTEFNFLGRVIERFCDYCDVLIFIRKPPLFIHSIHPTHTIGPMDSL